MQTYAQLLLSIPKRLAEAGCDAPRIEAEYLLSMATGQPRAYFLTHRNEALASVEIAAQLEALVRRRLKREPLAYILSTAEFYGREFAVTPDTLIPRSDTEVLIDVVLRELGWRQRNKQGEDCSPLILDLGTGTGCIIITLLSELSRMRARGIAVDLSPGALKVCANNAESLHVADQLTLHEGSWFEPLPDALHESFDLIVSNPPYVAESERPELMPEVRDWEPELALYAPGDGTKEYAHLLAHAQTWLKPGAHLLLELGFGQAERVKQMAAQSGWTEIATHDDYAGIPRVLVARKALTSIGERAMKTDSA